MSIAKGAFVNDLDGLNAIIKDTEPVPRTQWDKRFIETLIEDPKSFIKGSTEKKL
jgi:hypothetical protein